MNSHKIKPATPIKEKQVHGTSLKPVSNLVAANPLFYRCHSKHQLAASILFGQAHATPFKITFEHLEHVAILEGKACETCFSEGVIVIDFQFPAIIRLKFQHQCP